MAVASIFQIKVKQLIQLLLPEHYITITTLRLFSVQMASIIIIIIIAIIVLTILF